MSPARPKDSEGWDSDDRRRYNEYVSNCNKNGRDPIDRSLWFKLRHDPDHPRRSPYKHLEPRAAVTPIDSGLKVQLPPDPDLTAEQIIARQKEEFLARKAHEEATRLLHASVPERGPIGVLFFGDPHLDDGGTDWFSVERDLGLVRGTRGLYGANIGDTTNNWIGRLTALHGSQSTTAVNAWKLAEYFVSAIAGKWLFHVGGNHDGWSSDRDPLRYICRDAGALYLPCEARISLDFQDGHPLIVNARHDFPGNSMWNTAHAPNKAFTMGFRDEVYVCGHKHKSGYNVLRAPDGTVGHAIQISSYKMYDRYAKEKGFRDQTLGPSCLIVIDPNATENVDRVQVFWNTERGAKYLKWLRGDK